MAAFPSQQLYLNQIANNRQMGRLQYEAAQRQARIYNQMQMCTGSSCYYTGQASMATHMAQMSQLSDVYQSNFGGLYGQAGNSQDSGASSNAGRISKAFVEAEQAKAKQAEALKRYTTEPEKKYPPLSLKTSPLFGFMRYRFDSPIEAFRMWIFRWLHRSARGMA